VVQVSADAVTGQRLSAKPYLQYLTEKYSEIYELG